MTLAQRFGRNVRDARRRIEITQQEVATATGMSRDSIHKIERGHRSVRLLTLLKLADALEVDPCELLKGLRL